jgi:hypothetical protein
LFILIHFFFAFFLLIFCVDQQLKRNIICKRKCFNILDDDDNNNCFLCSCSISQYSTKDDVDDPKNLLEINKIEESFIKYNDYHPSFLFTLMVSGLTTPVYTAVSGFIYLLHEIKQISYNSTTSKYKIISIGYLIIGSCFTSITYIGII